MTDYDKKFAGFIALCADAQQQGLDAVAVSHPTVLGDTYAELIESLTRLAEAGLALHITGRGPTATVVPFKPGTED